MSHSIPSWLTTSALVLAACALTGCGDDGGDDAAASGTGGAAGQTGTGGSSATSGGSSIPGVGGSMTATTPGQFFINEVMPSNTMTIQDESGAFPDWIEIYNAADGPSDLGGYWISDKTDNRFKEQLLQGLVVPAGGVALLFADSDPEEGIHHLTFNLNRDGEAVVLSDPDGNEVDSVTWTTAPSDQSYARTTDGAGTFVWCATPTPGVLNGTSCAQ